MEPSRSFFGTVFIHLLSNGLLSKPNLHFFPDADAFYLYSFFIFVKNRIMTAWTLLFFSGQEILIVVLAVLLLFGSKEIPRMARMFGQGMKEFRRATDDIKREMQDSSADVVKDFKEIRDDLKKDANEVVENVKKQVDSDFDSDSKSD